MYDTCCYFQTALLAVIKFPTINMLEAGKCILAQGGGTEWIAHYLNTARDKHQVLSSFDSLAPTSPSNIY